MQKERGTGYKILCSQRKDKTAGKHVRRRGNSVFWTKL